MIHLPPIILVIYALATHRITRAVTTDQISEPIRDKIHKRGHRKMVRLRQDGSATDEIRWVEREDRRISVWAYKLVSCPWCFSVYAGSGVVVMERVCGSSFVYVAAVLAFSSVAGFVAERTS